MKSFIGFRLRKGLDTDLQDALKALTNEQISELCRCALRRELGITKQRVIEVREVPLPAPKVYLAGRK